RRASSSCMLSARPDLEVILRAGLDQFGSVQGAVDRIVRNRDAEVLVEAHDQIRAPRRPSGRRADRSCGRIRRWNAAARAGCRVRGNAAQAQLWSLPAGSAPARPPWGVATATLRLLAPARARCGAWLRVPVGGKHGRD